MKLKLLRYWGLVPTFIVLLLVALPRTHAQAERHESDFVMTKKAVEVMEYDVRGVKTSSWTMPVYVMRHRITGHCWLGSERHYMVASNDVRMNYTWTSAPTAVCK